MSIQALIEANSVTLSKLSGVIILLTVCNATPAIKNLLKLARYIACTFGSGSVKLFFICIESIPITFILLRSPISFFSDTNSIASLNLPIDKALSDAYLVTSLIIGWLTKFNAVSIVIPAL